MQTNGFTLDQNWLKGLNSQTVQGRCTVEHNGMLTNYLIENIPYYGILALDHLLSGLDGGSHATHLQTTVNEGLEQLQSHLLGQTALMQSEERSAGNNGTA